MIGELTELNVLETMDDSAAAGGGGGGDHTALATYLVGSVDP